MKKVLFLAAMSALLLTGCNGGGQTNTSEEPQKDPDEVTVFILSGQSNMEGNTSFKNGNTNLIESAFTDMGLSDYEVCMDGIEEVQTSYYCSGYGQLPQPNSEGVVTNYNGPHASNKENGIQGKFEPTKAGMGLNDSKMGPELGAAYALRDFATADNPIYFIKMASGGSGFAQSGTPYNWDVTKDQNGANMYNTFFKPFVQNNLDNLVAEGKHPIIKGWLWHQGESDTEQSKIDAYAERLKNLVEKFRDDFKDYGRDGDGDNIPFIDGMIYQGSGTAWGKDTSVNMNNVKKAFAESDDVPNTYLVDNYANMEQVPENELKPGNPGGDNMHYCTKDSLRLGIGYASVIINNHLLDI